MPARIERQVGAVVVAAGTLAANGVLPIGDIPVPANKKWNLNLILQSTDAAATRNARLMLAGGIPAHGLMSLAMSAVLGSNAVWHVSSAGTFVAVQVSTTRVDLYLRVGLAGLQYLDSFADSATITNVRFSPDERWLAWTTSAFLNVFARSVSSTTGFGTTVATSPAMASGAGSGINFPTTVVPRGISWSPTGAYIAVAQNLTAAAGRMSVFPFAGGVFGTRVDMPGMTAAQTAQKSHIAWAPDESAIAVMYGLNATSTSLYGWPWTAGAAGAISIKSDAVLAFGGGANNQVAGVVEWCPDASTLMVAVKGCCNVGNAAHVLTYRWSSSVWQAVQSLTDTGTNQVVGTLKWLTSRQVAAMADGAATRSFTVDAVTIAGVLIANLVGTATSPPAAMGDGQAELLNGVLFRTNNAKTAILVETVLASAVTLFPLISIAANSRVLLQGIVLEAGQRLLLGTPANTDVFSISASAIEIG